MGRKGGKKCLGFNLPISGNLYSARNAFSRIVSVSLSNSDFLFASETLRVLFLDGRLSCGKAGFVTFPSDARSLIR
jgi:hypothetical protein